MKTKPTKLAVLDFDGTLVYTPHPNDSREGVPILEYYDRWLKENNLPKRRFMGWWGRRETLMPPIFGEYADGKLVPPPDKLNAELAEKVREMRADDDTLCVLMTGRHVKMTHPETREHVCKTILDAYGLEFDKYFYLSNGGIGTIVFKINVIQTLLREFGSIAEVKIWEDREAHVSEFWNFIKYEKKRGSIAKGVVHQVYPPW